MSPTILDSWILNLIGNAMKSTPAGHLYIGVRCESSTAFLSPESRSSGMRALNCSRDTAYPGFWPNSGQQL